MARAPNSSTGKWRKSPPDLIALFDEVLPKELDVERRQMFGYPCAFVNGNMFTGLHQESMMVRLGEADRQRLIENDGASLFEPMPGRAMKEYVALPDTILDDMPRLTAVMASAYGYARTLPPKVKKTRK